MSARNRYFEDERLETVDPRTLRRLMGYLKPYKLQVILALFLMAVARLADLLNPILIIIAIDNILQMVTEGVNKCCPGLSAYWL